MKNNTEETKIWLQKALLSAPQDFTLSEVRSYIKAALVKLENIENKRQKREIAFEKRKVHGNNSTIQAIDEMISEEKAKLDEIHRRKNKPKDRSEDDDLQLLG